jgi:hypothetical protein
MSDLFTFDENNKDKIFLDKKQFKEQLEPKIKNKTLFVESGFPMIHDSIPYDNIRQRHCVIEISNACCIILNMYFYQDTCWFKIRPLTGFHGPDFAELLDIPNIKIQLVPYGLKNTNGSFLITSFYIKNCVS